MLKCGPTSIFVKQTGDCQLWYAPVPKGKQVEVTVCALDVSCSSVAESKICTQLTALGTELCVCDHQRPFQPDFFGYPPSSRHCQLALSRTQRGQDLLEQSRGTVTRTYQFRRLADGARMFRRTVPAKMLGQGCGDLRVDEFEVAEFHDR